MNNMSEAPIGIFDSGIGGMTVARAVKKALPNESIIYFGDTKHLPYGDKSTDAIRSYSVRITDFLLEKGCKAVLIACNSASSAAYDLVQEHVNGKALVFNVIDPVIRYVNEHFSKARVGLIGTKQTINSGVYAKKLQQLNPEIKIQPLATPLLAHLIEEGFYHNKVSYEIVSGYLSSGELANINALILGCTHYPLIKKEIKEFYKEGVEVIDSSEIVADCLRYVLEKKGLLSDKVSPEMHFYVSDYTKSFEESTKIFFGKRINLEQV